MHVYDADGNDLGAMISLSEKQQAVLAAGGSINVFYRTPQLMHGELGQCTGSFSLMQEDDRLLTADPAAVKEFLKIRAAIAAWTETN
jgi:hypothetical protein